MNPPDDGLVSFTLSGSDNESGYAVPAPTPDSTPLQWYGPGQRPTVAGLVIPGGLVYAGVPEFFKTADPGFIDVTLPIASQFVPPSYRGCDFWPKYNELTPSARRAYIQWLAGGRRDPMANIGYVFLFFYGLEYRCLADSPTAADLQAIVSELKRLLYIYTNASFQRYANQLLRVLTAKVVSVPNPSRPTVVQLMQSWTAMLPRELKVGLATNAIFENPLSASMAMQWAQFYRGNQPHPSFIYGKLARQLFESRYVERYGKGMVPCYQLARNTIEYLPASSGFNGRRFSWDLGQKPGVYEVVAPDNGLVELLDEVVASLRPYHRFIGSRPLPRGMSINEMLEWRDGSNIDCLEALALLPHVLWPADLKVRWDAFREHLSLGPRVLSVANLASFMGVAPDLTPNGLAGLRAVCPTEFLGVEPHARGAKQLQESTRLVAFAGNADVLASVSAQLEAVETMVAIAAWVAAELGGMSANRLAVLKQDLQVWPSLSPAERQWACCYADFVVEALPTTIIRLRNRVKAQGEQGLENMRYLARLAHADGVPAAAEIKLLEKLYKGVGLPVQGLYTDLHEPGQPKPQSAAGAGPVVKLDRAKIDLLQEETKAVAKLLNGVFVEDEVVEPQTPATVTPPAAGAPQVTLWGLSVNQHAFLRALLEQAEWSRDALETLASAHSLMLDGTLETLNEAALDNTGLPLTEGDSPVEVSPDLRNELAQELSLT